jgi:WD40 repeat protein
MSAHVDHRVFISYARKDAAPLAQRLQRDLTTKGLEVWLDTNRISGGATWTVEIERAIDRSQVVLVLLTQGSYVSDICRAEQLRSLRKGKSVIPILAQSGIDIPLHLETKNYRDFTAAEKYSAQLSFLIEDVGTGNNAVPLLEKFRTTYVTAPPLPRNYVERTGAVSNLRDTLITDDPSPCIALTALRGMGGIGKTVLAQALCHDEVVQQAFPDGIVWSTVGKEPSYDLITRMREVRRALGDEPTDKESELECINRYRSLMRDRAVLVIVDDVWRVSDVEPFLTESLRSRLLFTTRDASMSRFVGAREHKANLLDIVQSRELLAAWSNVDGSTLPEEADKLIDECGRLPLALSIVGAMLRGATKEFWSETLDLLRKADLDNIKKQLPRGQESFFRAVEVSVKDLDPEIQEHYKELAVLLEDIAAPLPVLETIWNTSKAEARRLSRCFVDRSLAQRDDVGEGIRLHDLQHDYIRAQYSDHEALDLIHGAVRLSSHVIGREPAQFASQMVGRLLPHQGVPAIKQFTAGLLEGASQPWLRSLQAALYPPGTSLVRTLGGHSDSVLGVAVSADGRIAVSASSDKTLKVWDLETGREMRTLEGHSDRVRGVAVTTDSRRAVSASDDKTLKVWDLNAGRELCTLKGHSNSVNGVAVSRDGRLAVSASSDKTLKVWDLETELELRTLKGHSAPVRAVTVTTDSRRAVSAADDKTLKVWDLETGRELCTLKGHSNSVNGVAMSRDGRLAVSASSDKTLKVWDLETGRELRTLKGHSAPVRAVTVTTDSRRAVSAADEKTLKVWDLETGLELRTLKGHSGRSSAVAVSANARIAVSGSRDKTVKVWDLERVRELCMLKGHSASVNGVAVSREQRLLVSASSDRTVKVWDLETGRELRTLKGHSAAVNGVAVSRDRRPAVSASSDKTLKVWDLETGRELRTLKGHSAAVNGVAVSRDGRLAVSASADKTLKVWDLENGRELRTLEGHSAAVNGVAVSRDGRLAVSASADKTLKVWDLENGRELRTLEGHSAPVRAVAVIRESRRAVSAADDKTLKMWDLETGRELCTLEGHSASVNGVAVSAEGQRAVSSSWDKTVKVWDLSARVQFATFTCDAGVPSCVFTGDNELFAGDYGGSAHFLRLEEPKPKD